MQCLNIFKMTIIKEVEHWINAGGTKITEAIVINKKGNPITLTYWTDDKNYGAEFYQGKNYLVDSYNSSIKSYSRNFVKLKGLPKEYRKVILELKKLHKQKWP